MDGFDSWTNRPTELIFPPGFRNPTANSLQLVAQDEENRSSQPASKWVNSHISIPSPSWTHVSVVIWACWRGCLFFNSRLCNIRVLFLSPSPSWVSLLAESHAHKDTDTPPSSFPPSPASGPPFMGLWMTAVPIWVLCFRREERRGCELSWASSDFHEIYCLPTAWPIFFYWLQRKLFFSCCVLGKKYVGCAFPGSFPSGSEYSDHVELLRISGVGLHFVEW